MEAGSVIFAAGHGSRMKGYSGNKTLLPLMPGTNPFTGDRPIIREVLRKLPQGPKALVLHHKRDLVMEATSGDDVFYCFQPLLNGTGGALLAARETLEQMVQNHIIVTMGDAPFVRKPTYNKLIDLLKEAHMAVLGFEPEDRAQYGVLEIEEGRVKRITEWKYWKDYPPEYIERLKICNSGIYAAKRDILLEYMDILKSNPHQVKKRRVGGLSTIEEYFITDLVEFLYRDGLTVAYASAENKLEVMGIDTLDDLLRAQQIFLNLEE